MNPTKNVLVKPVARLNDHASKVRELLRLATLRDLALYYAFAMRVNTNPEEGMRDVFECVLHMQQKAMVQLETFGVPMALQLPTPAPVGSPVEIVALISSHDVFLAEVRAIRDAFEHGRFAAFGLGAVARITAEIRHLSALHPDLPAPALGWVPAACELGVHPTQAETLTVVFADMTGTGLAEACLVQINAGQASLAA